MRDLSSLADRLRAAEVYDEFCELMFDQRTGYDELLEQLESWGISSSMGALSRFRASHNGPWAIARAKEQERAFLEAHGQDMDELERQFVAMRIFNDAASPETSTKDVLKMRDQHIKAAELKNTERKLDQAERRIAALEAQAAAAEESAARAKDIVKSGGMDEQTRALLIAEMDHLLLGRAKPSPVAAA